MIIWNTSHPFSHSQIKNLFTWDLPIHERVCVCLVQLAKNKLQCQTLWHLNKHLLISPKIFSKSSPSWAKNLISLEIHLIMSRTSFSFCISVSPIYFYYLIYFKYLLSPYVYLFWSEKELSFLYNLINKNCDGHAWSMSRAVVIITITWYKLRGLWFWRHLC